jgi:2-iminobutanoate/2-iminopropanoate deaminase
VTRTCFANPSSPPGLAFAGAVEWNGFVFISGCLGNAPGESKLVEGGFQAELDQVFDNVLAGLYHAGLAPMDVVKITIYLTDLSRFGLVDAAFARCFGRGKVARTTVEVSKLGLGASVELDAIAARPAAKAGE